jgi:septal ring factor EnvC (AmiA/AmiB activator)
MRVPPRGIGQRVRGMGPPHGLRPSAGVPGKRTRTVERPEMSCPQTLARGASRARRSLTATLAALLLACLSGIAPADPASADDELKQAKRELRQTREQVREKTTKIGTLQRRMDRLATRIARTEARVIETERHLDRLERGMIARRAQAALL